MRIANLKTHLLAITAICGIVVVMYSTMSSRLSPVGDGGVRGDRYIQIDSASWGLNCNPYVADALKSWKLPSDPQKPVPPKPHPAQPDNALTALSDACNGKLTCTFTATAAVIGDDPLPACNKQLNVRYRCADFEKFINVPAASGTLRLDCTPAVATDPSPNTASPHAR